MESTIKYRFAYDENDCVVKIDEITENDRENHKYHCVSCGNEMIAKLGVKNVHHFAHKTDCSCNGETYLHKLAKKLIKKKFDESEKFKIYLKQRVICKKEGECKFFSDAKCCDIDYNGFDLKKYYNKCQEEGPIKDKKGNKYIADLLLLHTEKNDRDPLLIEFVVSHKCSEEKLKSELRIIEISIEKENDIINLYNSEAWEYNVQNKYHNFQKNIKSEKTFRKNKLTKIVLNKNGLIKLENVYCDNVKSEKSVVEVNVLPNFQQKNNYKPMTIESATYCLLKLGYSVQSCLLCKNYEQQGNKRICNVNKIHLTPVSPNWDTANYCKYYVYDKLKIEHKIRYIPIDEVQVVE